MRIGPRLWIPPFVPIWIALLAPCALVSLQCRVVLAHDSTRDEIETLSTRIRGGEATASDLLRRGELHRLNGEWAAAAADYDRAALLDPASPRVPLCRAALFLAVGSADAAKRTLDRVLGRAPDDADALQLRAQALIALGRPLQAARDLDRMLAHIKRATPDHYLERARTLVRCGERYIGRALEGVDEGIQRLGTIVSLELFAIDLELRRRHFDAALARLDRLAPQLGQAGILLERRGELLAAAGRSDEARAAFAAALAEIESLAPQRRSTLAVVEREARLRAAVGVAPAPVDQPASHANSSPGEDPR